MMADELTWDVAGVRQIRGGEWPIDVSITTSTGQRQPAIHTDGQIG